MTKLERLLNGTRFADDAVRFGLSGLLNTIVGVAVYQMALWWFAPTTAYVLAWMCGIAMVALLHPTVVFRGNKAGHLRRWANIASYVLAFCFGLLATNWLVDNADIPERLVIFPVIVATTCTNFLFSRTLYRLFFTESEN